MQENCRYFFYTRKLSIKIISSFNFNWDVDEQAGKLTSNTSGHLCHLNILCKPIKKLRSQFKRPSSHKASWNSAKAEDSLNRYWNVTFNQGNGCLTITTRQLRNALNVNLILPLKTLFHVDTFVASCEPKFGAFYERRNEKLIFSPQATANLRHL